MAQASFSELLSLRMDIENTAKVLKDLEEVKKAIHKFNTAVTDSGTYARKAFNEIQKGINQTEKEEKRLSNEKQRMLNADLKAAENAINKELALYRQLEIAKAKAMATYGKIPASVSVSQAMNIPLDAKFKSTSATDLRNSNITAYRQALQDIKLMNVEERKLLAEEKQRTQELARQSKEMKNQEKSAYSIGKTLHSMRS